MALVTTGNKKATPFHLQCSTTGLFMADATSDFKVFAVTHRAEFAFQFPCADSVEHGRKFVKALYPSFDWKAVPVQCERVESFFLTRHAA